MMTATNLTTGEIYYFDAPNLPAGIDPAAWCVLASDLLANNRAGNLAQDVFNPRQLVLNNLHRFTLGDRSIAVGDWCARLDGAMAV